MPEVVLYVIPGCEMCRKVREYIRRRHIPFQEVNALESPRRLVKLPSGFRPEFPIVTVNTRVLDGTDFRRLSAALKEHASTAANPSGPQ